MCSKGFEVRVWSVLPPSLGLLGPRWLTIPPSPSPSSLTLTLYRPSLPTLLRPLFSPILPDPYRNNEVYYQSADEVRRSQAGHKNRLSTVFWYMSDCDGGYTAFPSAPIHEPHVSQILCEKEEEDGGEGRVSLCTREVEPANSTIDHYTGVSSCQYGLRVPPKSGRAILFYSMLPSGRGDELALHSACAVKSGIKWAANKWVWNQPLWP
jgi:hypothetical protein